MNETLWEGQRMTDSRPSMARRVTPRDRQRKHSELAGPSLAITVDGVTYAIREGDLSASDVSALRREIGMSFRAVLKAATTDPDIDVIAAIVWLARRAEGENLLSFSEVADEIGYDVDVQVVGDEAEVSDSPEA